MDRASPGAVLMHRTSQSARLFGRHRLSPQATSMNGLTINAQMSLDELPTAEAGADVVDQPFFAAGNVATAGGCLSSQYLAAWVIARLAGDQTARDALFYVAPVGEKDEYVDRAMRHVQSFLPTVASA